MPMTPQDSNKVVNQLYSSIVASLTSGGDGNAAAFDPNKTFFTLEPKGRIIDPNDYAGAWTPGNPNGSLDAAAAIADLADETFQMSAMRTPSMVTVPQIYEQVLRATVTQHKDLTPQRQAQYDKAYALLFVDAPNPDVPGQTISSQSPVYQTYITNQNAYNNAMTAYRSAYAAAMADPKLKAQWPLLGPSLQVPVHQAWQAWRAQHADQVEAALADLATAGQDQVKRAFADAQELYDGYALTLDEGLKRRRSSLVPTNWYQPGVSNGWPTARYSTATMQADESSDYTKVSGGAGFSLGLWSVGGSGGSTTTHHHSDAAASSLNISYQFALVTMRRPWLNGLLFQLPGWNTDAFPKGMISSGTRQNQANTKMPLLPQAFLVIKNLVITGSFSSQELNEMSHQVSAGASVGWGPFSVSGSYQHGSQSRSMKGTVNSAGIQVPFVQIIGWVSNIVPFSPPN